MKRSDAREILFTLVFEAGFKADEKIEDIYSDAVENEYFNENDKVQSAYIKDSLIGIYDKKDDLDEKIRENLSNWKLERLPRVSLALLRLGIYEIEYNSDIPDEVAVNEAVELAKKYEMPEQASFVNAVLDKVIKSK